EGKRLHQGAFQTFTVPTAIERLGDFSQTLNAQGQRRIIYNPFAPRPDSANPGQLLRDPFPGNVIPATLMDPVAQKALTYYPAPNGPGLPFTRQNNLVMFASRPFPTDREDLKADHRFSDTKRLFVRYDHLRNETADINFWN